MTATRLDDFRRTLTDLSRRVGATAAGLEDAARAPLGGDAGGNLSNAPMHLADLGSEAYAQELSATLLENEAYVRDEVAAALGRLDAGTFGRCERCGSEVPAERLEALPYVRYCRPCAEAAADAPRVNLDAGRPAGFRPGLAADPTDVHAVGTAGGGTAVGGLAGSPVGHGDPNPADLDAAMASGSYDVEAETDDDKRAGYGGPTGGAVGGTPAGKRSTGGRTGGGLRPGPDRDVAAPTGEGR